MIKINLITNHNYKDDDDLRKYKKTKKIPIHNLNP